MNKCPVKRWSFLESCFRASRLEKTLKFCIRLNMSSKHMSRFWLPLKVLKVNLHTVMFAVVSTRWTCLECRPRPCYVLITRFMFQYAVAPDVQKKIYMCRHVKLNFAVVSGLVTNLSATHAWNSQPSTSHLILQRSLMLLWVFTVFIKNECQNVSVLIESTSKSHLNLKTHFLFFVYKVKLANSKYKLVFSICHL